MAWVPPANGRRGRQQSFSDAAIQTCLTLRVLFGLPLRQTTSFVQSLLRLIGLDWAAPDFSTLCRRQNTLNVRLPYRGGTGPLNLLIDSTSIKSEGEGEWNARKHGVPKRCIWRKIHIGIDEETLEFRAVEVTTRNIGDAPVPPEFLDKSHPIRTSAASLQMGRLILENATRRLPPVMLMLSFHRARMPSDGSPQAPMPPPETRPSTRSDTSAALCGDGGADTALEAVSKPRCIV